MSPTDISRSTALLFPPFAARLAAALGEARAAGLDVHIFEGWRPPSRQAYLYAAGRTTAGPKVTNAEAWESWHQYGFAADLAFGGAGRWTWRGDWPAVRAVMARHGLRSLAPYEEAHVEWPVALATVAARELAQRDGLLSVWQKVEASIKVA